MSIYSCYYFVQKINLKRKLFLLKVGEVLAVGEIRRITVVFCKVGFPWNCFKAATEFQNRIWKHHQQTQKHKKKETSLTYQMDEAGCRPPDGHEHCHQLK